MPRPVYVGVGECACGRLDTRLYHMPNTTMLVYPVCGKCLVVRGFAEPAPRTAADIVDVDGQLAWKSDEPLVHVGKLDLGHGHVFEVVMGTDDQLVGWMHTHPDERGGLEPCQSFCAVRQIDGAPVHQVMCASPLSLTPSLKCRTCGAHGHVTDGKWEPCP